MNELVMKLTKEQPLIVSLRPAPSREALRDAIGRGWIHLKFTETRGGTELGIPIDRERSDLSGADLEQGTGTLRIVGELTLDYVHVRMVAKVDVASFQGTGHLEVLGEAEPAAAAVGPDSAAAEIGGTN
jgi:hypothetical protein